MRNIRLAGLHTSALLAFPSSGSGRAAAPRRARETRYFIIELFFIFSLAEGKNEEQRKEEVPERSPQAFGFHNSKPRWVATPGAAWNYQTPASARRWARPSVRRWRSRAGSRG